MDYSSLSDMELVMKIRTNPRTSGEYALARGEIASRCHEYIRKSVHTYCMPEAEAVKVADEVFVDLDKALLDYKKGERLAPHLAAYARKSIAGPRWRLNPAFYRAAYAAAAAAVSAVIIVFFFTGRSRPAAPENYFAAVHEKFGGTSAGMVKLGSGTFIKLDGNSAVESLSAVSNGKVTADFRLTSGRIECRVRKLKEGEYFRIETEAGSARAVGTFFCVSWSNHVMTVEVAEGRVEVFDRINMTNFLVGENRSCRAGIHTPDLKRETGPEKGENTNRDEEQIREPRNALGDK